MRALSAAVARLLLALAFTPLPLGPLAAHAAERVEVRTWSPLERLLFEAADSESPGFQVYSPIEMAIAGRVDVERIRDGLGRTPLMVAVLADNPFFASYLLSRLPRPRDGRAPEPPRDADGLTALELAQETGNDPMVALLSLGPGAGLEALSLAYIDAGGTRAGDRGLYLPTTPDPATTATATHAAAPPAAASAAPPTRARARAAAAEAPGGTTPFQLALVGPVAVVPSTRIGVKGLSLSLLYGVTRSTYGIDLGVASRSRESAGGVHASLLASGTGGDFTGVRLTGGFGMSGGAVRGVAIALLANAGLRSFEESACYGLCVAGATNFYDAGGGIHLSGINLFVRGAPALSIGLANAYINEASGVQVALLNHVSHDFDGLQIGLVSNWNNFLTYESGSTDMGSYRIVETTTYTWRGHTRGVQIAPLTNVVDSMDGLQIAFGNNAMGSFHGVQLGVLMNISSGRPDRGDSSGLQISCFNGTRGFRGAQIGAFNGAGEVRGVQVGLINFATRLHGLQIGALNIAWKNPLPVMVLFNAG